MKLSEMRVAVIGGGIGGMAAAARLAQMGARVTLYEQAPALAEVGAGLQVSPNGQRVLRALGAVSLPGAAEIPAGATPSSGTVFRDGRSGRAVARVRPPDSGQSWYMHRADLLDLLVQSADRAGVTVALDRVIGPGAVQADLIIAADGVKTLWRSMVDGPVEPAFTGQVAWRALVPGPVAQDTAASLSMGHRAHVVSYPLQGRGVTNVVAIEERRDWQDESWSQTGAPEEFRARFADFVGVAGDAIARAAEVHTWALFARPVVRHWYKDNVVLLGDAAHPTLPFMAQGACLALEDAWVLGAALEAAPDLATALARYQDLRADRAARVVALASGNSWRFHMGWPFNWGAYATLALGAGLLARRLEWVYGYDATAVVSAT